MERLPFFHAALDSAVLRRLCFFQLHFEHSKFKGDGWHGIFRYDYSWRHCLFYLAGGVSVAAVLGFVLREPDLVENGTGGPVAPTPVPKPAPTRPQVSTPANAVIVVSVNRAGVSQGSFPEPQFKAAIANGVVLPTDHYWQPGMKEWRPVSEYPNP